MSENCLFCGIVAGNIPSTQVGENERAIAFMDIAPATPGHLLVIPRAHSADLRETAPEDLTAVTLLAQSLISRVIERLDGATGANLLSCIGPDAWQTVFHTHLHVIPRYPNDPLQLPWQPHSGDLDAIRAVGEQLS
ncbi:HIT domain-containing protein [Kribbella sandramycini]|uniref:HIT domain-containing protein n=1 Tax=Kribbella sandramycini TaxID=60450 RepID=A0A7Y4KZX2_9ACTN|nr:HIT domain-containing protein [Kribbella sandramycini]MBB6569152.1 histidine triad (HIT) family protein [Kribbella sandramycini]NOL41007.1 HIT domain-containing protein [Kribbella sandramycini]